MESIDLFNSISPIDFRYYGRNEQIKEKLQPYLSEEAFIKYLAKAESALTNTLAERGVCSKEIAEEIENVSKQITATEVYLEEDRVKHPISSLVNCIRNRVSSQAKPYVHFTATSNDIICPADAARYRDFTNNVLMPKLLEFEKTLITLSRREKNTVQIGRTHGQHAEPITFGFAIAQYVSRLGSRIIKIRETANDLRGKIAGAVGAYNASSMFFDDPSQFEAEVLSRLHLEPSPISTQIIEAEFMTDYVHSIISSFSVLANLADDMRHLQRSEIGEVQEEFVAKQVGSSTMPQKRNPINFEYVKSMWKTIMPRMVTIYSDQLSEHQRDLTNLESSRFIAEILAVFYVCLSLLSEVMAKLTVDRLNMKKNLDMSKDMAAAEPAQVLLSAYGHPNAHEYITKLTLKSERTRKPFTELLFEDKELKNYLVKFNEKQLNVLKNPEDGFLGIAIQKVEDVCHHWERKLKVEDKSTKIYNKFKGSTYRMVPPISTDMNSNKPR
ncbi:lyase family protein [Chloroflexota bacterium]